MTSSYDYIIAGAGAAGLSLAVHMIHSGQFKDKRILIIDKDAKKQNDRTWCFWETEPGLFDSIVYKKWERARFYGMEFERLLNLAPYQYKLIRGIDFYEYALSLIRAHSNFEFRQGSIEEMKSENNETWISVEGERVNTEYIFNSILFEKPALQENESWLLQHFKGWIIETEQATFDPGVATLMDFRVNQDQGTTFVYVMPFTSTRALVEYTLFSENILSPAEYERGLREYIEQQLSLSSYRITEEEFGVIPMTNHKFIRQQGNIVNIGTAGGQTKASSGYTFRFIQKHSANLVASLITTGKPFSGNAKPKGRFNFYDSVLLYILQHKKLPGHKVFTRLFQKNKPQHVLRFLDNESSFKEELKIISTLPTWPFLRAAIKQL